MSVSNRTDPRCPVKPLARAGWIRKSFKGTNWRGLSAVIAFFAAWYAAVLLRIPGFTEIPTPPEVVHTFIADELFNAKYWNSWIVSFERVMYGFILAQILGIPLGFAFGSSRVFREFAFPIFELLRPIPPLAWVPISILFWPTNESSIVFITFIGAFFVIVINVYDGVGEIKKEHLWLAKSLGASRLSILRRIMLPSVIPSIAVGMTLGIAITWNVVIAAEMISSDNGLGRLTWEGYVSNTPTVVFVGMISIGIAGYLSGLLIDYVEKKMMPWQSEK